MTTHATPSGSVVPPSGAAIDGLDVLDLCHRHMIFKLGKLSALISRLSAAPDDEAREMAVDIIEFFSITVRQHHEDEERHVFPRVFATGRAEAVQAIVKLQQDHDWLEEDWMELLPHLAAVASDRGRYDLALLRDGAAAFGALLLDHIALEESLIYPQARQRMNAAERREAGREMAARRRAEREDA